MFDKIIVLMLITVSSVFANNEKNPFFQLQRAIEQNPNLSGDFYYFLRIIGFLLFMYGLYNAFVSDNQQKTGQQKFWSGMFMFGGSAILLNFKGFLGVLASV